MSEPAASDAAVRATNDEAFTAKASAAAKGYFTDPFLLAMAQATSIKSGGKVQPVRQPMINRGTYARVHVMRRAVERFLEALPAADTAQIISFGAGFDTLPFTVFQNNPHRVLRYLELDFVDIVRIKSEAIAVTPSVAAIFNSMVHNPDKGIKAHTRTGSTYQFSVCDIRDIQCVLRVFGSAEISFDVPTMFLTECVLVYLEPSASDKLVRMTCSEFRNVRAFINFDPVQPDDPFGKQMVTNVAYRGSPFLGITTYPSVVSQQIRFHAAGWKYAEVFSMSDVFKSKLDANEINRINRLEMLDELEEWMMMMDHYCFVWAWMSPDDRSGTHINLWS